VVAGGRPEAVSWAYGATYGELSPDKLVYSFPQDFGRPYLIGLNAGRWVYAENTRQQAASIADILHASTLAVVLKHAGSIAGNTSGESIGDEGGGDVC